MRNYTRQGLYEYRVYFTDSSGFEFHHRVCAHGETHAVCMAMLADREYGNGDEITFLRVEKE